MKWRCGGSHWETNEVALRGVTRGTNEVVISHGETNLVALRGGHTGHQRSGAAGGHTGKPI